MAAAGVSDGVGVGVSDGSAVGVGVLTEGVLEALGEVVGRAVALGGVVVAGWLVEGGVPGEVVRGDGVAV